MPIASVIIPAYNEEFTIERCLENLLKDTPKGLLEVVVVCNGCQDNTFSRACKFEDRGVRVLETAVGSKSNALNLGDAEATVFPRFYLDADIQLSIDSLREVVLLLSDDEDVLLSAPRAVVDFARSSALVRAYYRVWTRLPYFTEAMVGSGVYAFSEKGRSRFKEFPDIIADDEYARRVVSPKERRSAKGEPFVISAPRSLRSLLAVNSRVRAGMYELEKKYPELMAHRGTTPGRTLQTIASKKELWRDAPIYLGIMFAAKLLAHRKLASKNAKKWDRDETARSAAPGPTSPL